MTDEPRQPNPDTTPDQTKSSLARHPLFTGTGGAVLGALAAVILSSVLASDRTVVSTQTVHGPTVTQYVPVGQSGKRPCSGSKVAGGPPYEPNNTIAEAYGPLKSGQPVTASLGGPREEDEDVDFYAFCIGRSAAISIELRKTGCASSSEDFSTDCTGLREQLINNRGESIQTATVGETTQATLAKRLSPGRYYVRVFEAQGAKYELEVGAGSVPLQATIP
jgi:hypothetical protein